MPASQAEDQRDPLLDIALQLGGTLDLEPLLRLVVDRLRTSLGAERALFALCDEDGRIGRVVAENVEWDGAGKLPISHGVAARVLRDRQPLVLTNALEEGGFQDNPSVQALGLRFVVAVPVLGRERPLGLLWVDDRQPTVAEMAERIDQLTAIARIVGAAVENAQLYERQRARAHLLTELVHDFRLPLTVIASNTELLAEEAAPEHAPLLADLHAATQRIGRMIDGTLALARCESDPRGSRASRLDLRATIERHVASVAAVARERALSIAVRAEASLPEVETSAERIGVLVDNLIGNALDHAIDATTVRIDLRAREDAGPSRPGRAVDEAPWATRQAVPLRAKADARWVEVSISNEGRRIPAELLPRMFEPFVRGGDRPRGGGSGLGLWIADRCAHQLGGNLWVDSDEGRGTRFVFTVPTAIEAIEDA